jgi:peptidoglycan/LPS O-acetylase OafA/YrhL
MATEDRLMQAKTSVAMPEVSPGTKNRIAALDFTKGVLVLFMVLYHWLNYFYSPTGSFYRYLRFLTPSFIFITGFLISHVYFAKYRNPNGQSPMRLAVRGLKLLGVFVLLNGAIAMVPGSPTRGILLGNSLVANMTAIFITGNVLAQLGKTASFEILVPISYLLLISALLLPVSRFSLYVFHAFCVAMLGCVFFLGQAGIQSDNLELLTIGLLGVVCGFASSAAIKKPLSHRYALALSYGGYLCAITILDVPFVLRVVGVCLTLMLIYAVGDRSQQPGLWMSHIIVLGRYSLFGYIAQIAILQLLHRVLGHGMTGIGALGVSLLGGFALTMGSVELVDRLRPKSPALDRFYRAAFA